MRERKRRTVLLTTVATLVIAGLVMVTVGACGEEDSATAGPATTASSSSSEMADPSVDSEGVVVAKEILTTFDELVGEAAELAKEKPDPAVLKPQLEDLYDSYQPTMTRLNGQYLALRDADIVEFGACNTYLGEYRGTHVAGKDTLLSEAALYYNLELGDQETVSLLSDGPIELLDVAVAQD